MPAFYRLGRFLVCLWCLIMAPWCYWHGYLVLAVLWLIMWRLVLDIERRHQETERGR